MQLWRSLATAGVGALAVAALAAAGVLPTTGPSGVLAGEQIAVAYVAFFAGVAALVAAALARGTSQLHGALRSARRAD